MGRRPLLVMVLGWFAVVGAVGAITFVVVSNAGSGVGRASAAERVIVDSSEASGTTTVTSSGTPTPSVTPSPAITPAPSPTTSSRPSDAPEPRPTSRAPRPRTPADPHAASFSTPGGIVVATCRGSQVVRKSIRPRDGWSYDEEKKPQGALEVKFEASEREVEIYLRCVNGVPTRLKPGTNWGAGDQPSRESRSPWGVRPTEGVQSEGQEHATPTPSPSPSTSPSTEETHHD